MDSKVIGAKDSPCKGAETLAKSFAVEHEYTPDRKAMLAALRVLLGLPRILNHGKGDSSVCRSR